MKNVLRLSLAFLVASASLVEGQRMTEVVMTDKGPVRGRIFETIWLSKEYSSFEGIPYAEPPLKELRFHDPIDIAPWVEVINATNSVVLCAQFAGLSTLGSEDCLYLNVYTPRTDFLNILDKELRPVMFWIYGGGFGTGYSMRSIYGPDFFLEEDVVVVSVSYRVDITGFLALDLPGVEGNAGLKDQNLALKWVQKNIRQFGGDPNRVTIFGESAGAASVGYHMILSQSQGLFHQAIMQSGTPLCPWAYRERSDAIQRAFAVGELLGFKGATQLELLEFLQGVDLNDLIETSYYTGSNTLPAPLSFQFVPTKTDNFLDNCPIEKFKTGSFSRVPVLMGYNHDEAALFALVDDAVRLILHDTLARLGDLKPDPTVAELLLDVADTVVNASEWEMIDVASAFYFINPVDLTQRYLTKYGLEDVYYYRLSINTPYNLHRFIDGRLNGTSHADDIGYLFNVPVLYATDINHPLNQYRQRMVSMWTNFAKCGNPTPFMIPINGAVWLPSGILGKQLDINLINEMKERLLPPTYQVLESAYDATLPLCSDCNLPQLSDMVNVF